ncbi:oxidoreductase [Agrobacterium rhizogenes]|uniref:Oxidoreductase n=1 Tax=Rhizobium rhizogenes NBRC 13257 TaxID=1220581 RepID=A0AA87U5G4_RHIRH|nr:oxidoreductase [Rhizobium rhizogenes]KAA6486912.1 oxidoreductase [Agrobacterium sp. ICMP 7243]OCI97974.1 short-chain dehydrogenase/reductase [Agrobacterium sp. 13-626]MQB33315.1 oxidoreductase [Rhizobium rhizogenes]NTF47265.1 oxidoreductase [Rhizobium rhizogenes]NTF66779.1 oxidoreductase [Rhizobium rhizogenes]
MSDTKSDAKTLFITGVSTGFGRALAEVALAGGHKVVGTLRRQVDRVEFEALKPGSAFGKLLDVTDTAAIAPVVAEVEKEIGAIDVLVNNAGYGHEGLLEESTIDDLRRQFEVNVFGPVALIQAVLPYMRKRRAGHILNITSMGGIVTFPGLSVYHGSKFALEGISESLGKEVKSLGIHVTAVEPGGFRTDWAGRSMVRAERSISDYDEIFEPWRQRRLERSGKQPGDPKKAAHVMLQLIASENPPTHLLLGRDAISLVREKLGLLKTEFDAWEQVSASTDFE